jgi:hypothetical protein
MLGLLKLPNFNLWTGYRFLPQKLAVLGFVEKLYSRIQFPRKKPSTQEKKPQRHKGHKEKAKLMS